MLFTSTFATPLGEMIARASTQGICLLEFSDRPGSGRDLAEPEAHRDADYSGEPKKHLQALERELVDYFAGTLPHFTVPLDLSPGTPFQRSVWEMLLTIPPGQTTSYGNIAKRLGNSGASQAVGLANSSNRLAIIVPCHRVVGTGGKLTGYAGGLERKKWLLRHEGASLF